MKRWLPLSLLLALTLSTVAFAGVRLTNKDAKKYKFQMICKGSTTHSSIGANSSRSIKSGCKLSIAGNAIEVKDGQKCVIRGGKISCS